MTTGAKPRLLFLNNATRRDARPEVIGRMTAGQFDIDDIWAYNGEFPEDENEYAGVYLSGSPHGAYESVPWIEREHGLIERFAARGVPMLGVCFGSQILASALCGRDQVFRRNDCEVGYKWLDMQAIAAGDPVCRDMGARVRMFVWHNDEVSADHRDIRILASSDVCPNQIWRHGSAPAWGVQGHLEITRREAPDWFERNRGRLERDQADVDRLIAAPEEAAEAKMMLRNFLDLCLGTAHMQADRVEANRAEASA